MLQKNDLQRLVKEALDAQDGSANIVTVSKHIWDLHKNELKESGDLFYTWQYDIRWAANQLLNKGIMQDVDSSTKGIWSLK